MSEDADLRTRLELQDLTTQYGRGVDHRDFELLRSVFTQDARLAIVSREPGAEPSMDVRGRESVVDAMRGIRRYPVTTHFVGRQHVEVDGERAAGETYCIAYHLHDVDGRTFNYVMSIRYQDRYAVEDGRWKFSERVLVVDWTDDQPLNQVADPPQ